MGELKEPTKADLFRLFHQLEYFTGPGMPDAAAKLMFKKQIEHFKSEFKVPTAEENIANL